MIESAGTPLYALYGEPEREAGRDFLHVETIAARSRLHDWEIKPHCHRDLVQFLLMLGGTGELSLDARPEPLRAPALVVLRPMVVHGFRFAPDTNGHVLTVSERFIGEVLAERMAAEVRPALAEATVFSLRDEEVHQHGLQAHFEAVADELVWSAPGRITAIASHLGLVLAAVVRLTAMRRRDVQPQAAEDEIFLQFRQLVEGGFRERRQKIGDYAAMLGISEGRLKALCRRRAGRSPLGVIQARLLAEAQRQLLYTSMSVAEVGYGLGFDDPAYFSRFFSRHMSQAPSSYRRRHADAVRGETDARSLVGDPE